MIIDGRQHGTTLTDIRNDHKARYRWASEYAQHASVLDAACGVGYGCKILSENNVVVYGIDLSEKAIATANLYWKADNIHYLQADICEIGLPEVDVAVSFETIEHLPEPQKFLSRIQAPILLGSVPNQAVVPYDKERNPYHFRHYTIKDLKNILSECGWFLDELWYQHDKNEVGSKVSQTDPENAIVLVFKASKTT